MDYSLTSMIKLPIPEIEEELKQIADMLLATIDLRDKTTGRHSRNVALYALAIGTAMGLDKAQLKSLYIVGIFHDVGKFGISEKVLFKPGKLDREEFDLVKTHSKRSADIIRSIPLIKDLAQAVECHHERYDGTGYPYGLKGENIPLLSRIIAVADAFDAMTEDRCYKKSLCLKDAVTELEKMVFTQFDPAVVAAFVHWLDQQNLLSPEEALKKLDLQPAPGKGVVAGGKPESAARHGLAWVQEGQIFVKDPEQGQAKATLTPCTGITIHVNGVPVEAAIEVSAADEIKVLPLSHKEPGFIKVHVSQDKLSAYLEIKTDDLISYKLMDAGASHCLVLRAQQKRTKFAPVNFEGILKLLQKQGVEYGIDYTIIKQLIEYPYDGMVEVARGQAPTLPEDGKVELFFDESLDMAKTLENAGNIDFKEINKLPTVGVGDPLALNYDPQMGLPGKDVSGRIIPPTEPVQFNLLAGKGVELTDDGKKAFAVTEGLPKVKKRGVNWTVTVDSVLYHPGDVNLGTGNIRFRGNVQIAGCVDNGMSVSATGDVIVSSLVTGAKVTAGSNIIVKGNVVNGELIAGGFVILTQAIEPLIKRLYQYLDKVYGVALENYRYISSTQKVRFGHILTFLKEKKYRQELSYAETLERKLKEYDLKLLGVYEEMLTGAVNQLVGINIINFTGPEDFKSCIDNIRDVLNYVDSVSHSHGTIRLTCALNSTIASPGDVQVNGPGCFNTGIHSGGAVSITGVFRGGNIYAGDYLYICEAGSEMGTKTRLAVAEGKKIKLDGVYPGVCVQVGRRSKVLEDRLTRVEIFLDDDNNLKLSNY